MKEIYDVSDEYLNSQLKYLKLLSKQYSNISKASAEIINLKAILNLPKGTEHFLSDLHGEYESFVHVLKNASGVIKRKIEELFGNTIIESERKRLATLVYYPEQKLDLIIKEESEEDPRSPPSSFAGNSLTSGLTRISILPPAMATSWCSSPRSRPGR